MTEHNSWSRYMDATSHGDLNTVIAHKVGVDPATIGRWRTGAVDPKPRQVVEYARAYGQSPLAALIAAGYLTQEEIELPINIPNVSVADFDDLTLAEELLSRVRENRSPPTAQFPVVSDIGTGRADVVVFPDEDARTRK